ncbi:MAG: aminotransferase class III-fold pyridoxal phosphate-dependent enzyme [Polyangiaceae bacterium]
MRYGCVVLNRDRIVALDKKYVWHPYTAMDAYVERVNPIVVERAEGARFWDRDGRSYLDGNSSWWVAALGHNHPRLVAALIEQARKFCHVSLAGVTHEPAAALAEELSMVTPTGLNKVFFVDDGSTAIEAAVKIATQFWFQQGEPRRTKFVALEGAFHGETTAASSLGGVELFRKPFAGILFDCVHVDPPRDLSSYEKAFDAIHVVLESHASEIAAIVVEPLVQGADGMKMYPPRLLRDLRSLCDRLGTLLIADEVFTGYGRTGRFWACEQAGISPDILCTAKGFFRRFLMAATSVNERVYDAFRGHAHACSVTATRFAETHSVPP